MCGVGVSRSDAREMRVLTPLLALAASANGVTVGAPAPAFSGIAHDGRVVDLSTAKAAQNGLIIWFYPKAGTGG